MPSESEAPRRSRRWLKGSLKGGGIFLGGLLFLVLVAAVFLFFLAQTRPGQDLVLRTALGQADRFIEGTLEVEGIRSDGLLGGLTLRGVRLADSRGRPFLEADSIRVAYSLRNLIRRDIILAPVELWSPSVVLETLHGDEESNLARIFARPPTDPPAEPDVAPREEPTLRLELRNAAVHEGRIRVRTPLEGEPGPQVVAEEIPGFEGWHRVLAFRDVEARLDVVQLLGEPGERIQVASLSLEAEILPESFRVDDLRGELRRVGERLEVEAHQLWLEGTELDGRVALDWSDPEEEMALEVALEADPFRLEDFRWLEPRLPEGIGRFSVEGEGPITESRWRFSELELSTGSSNLRGRFGLQLGSQLRILDTDLEVVPVEVALLQPWFPEADLPAGRLRGRARLEGTLQALTLQTNLTYDDPQEDFLPSTLQASGVLLLNGAPGVRDLSLSVDPLDYALLGEFLPDLPLTGRGSLRVEAAGNLPQGLRFTADLRHEVDGLESRVLALGSVRESGDDFILAVDGNLEPLSLDGLARAGGWELPVTGELQAQLRAEGPLSNLLVAGPVQTPGGAVLATVRTNVRDPAAGYTVDAEAEDLALHAFLPDLPDPSSLTGRIQLEGRGLELETLAGEGEVEITGSRSGEVIVDRATARLQVREGRLLVDELEVDSPLANLTASGELGLREGSQEGTLVADWEVADLQRLRPLLMGDTLIVADTLTDLERQILIFEGADPESLDAENGAPLEGRARGNLQLQGWLGALDFQGEIVAEEIAWAEARLGSGVADVQGHLSEWVPTRITGDFTLEEPGWARWEMERVGGELTYEEGSGSARLDLLRREGENYMAQGDFVHDFLAVEVELNTLVLALDPVEWSLQQSSTIRVAGRRVEVDRLELRRPGNGEESGRLYLHGSLDLEGDSELELGTEGLELDRLATLLQLELEPRGTLNLDLDLRGPAEAPEIEGQILLENLVVNGMEASRVAGAVSYSDRLGRTSLEIDQGGRRLLRLTGTYPVDLALTQVEDRFPEEEVDLELAVDSLPAATVLGMLEVLEEVEGVLDGQLRLRGMPGSLEASGELRIAGGALSLPEVGFQAHDIQGTFSVEPDGMIRVDAEARAGGMAQVTGTVDLSDLTDPGFDLSINASGFQAVARRDLEARVGGEVQLTGRFTAPRITGNVRVDQGTIFLEEFTRTAEVIDLTDPAFFDVVDTTLVAAAPVVEAAQNPFLQNLRVDVDLGIQRDFWLRSQEMNVEMRGNLIVTFDRAQRDLLLVGTLEANRGNYNAFGRQFQVQEGVVEFVGVPGLNPSLEIRAVNRLRAEGGEPLNIFATVEGTLMNPRISLSSDAQPAIAQSDLISYLIFGRPSYALGSGETSVLDGAAGAGVSFGVGTVATQLSQVVARQVGLDFFNITQAQELEGMGAAQGGGALAGTQVEVGQYLRENLFLALVLRPLQGIGGGQTQIPGARLEWRFSDTWTLEAFLEDRFGRTGAFGFGDVGLQVNRILGFELFREWGY